MEQIDGPIPDERGDWRQLEQALRLRERAIAAAGNGIVISDPHRSDSPLIYCNPAFEKMTGYAAVDILGKNCRFLQFPPGVNTPTPENEEPLRVLRAALKEDRGCQVLLKNFRKDGTPFWNELTISPVFDPAGKLTHFVGVQADVTQRQETERELRAARLELERRVAERTAELSRANESLYEEILQRRRAERALRRAEKKYRSIVENAVEGIYQSTPEGHYLSVNPALARMYGYESPEALIAGVNNIEVDVYVNPFERQQFKRKIATQGMVQGFEYQVRRADGVHIWVSETARAVHDAHGCLIYYEGSIQDITARKQAEGEKTRLEGQLRQSQKMEAIGTLAGGIAHDFNNILTAILGYTELSLEDLSTSTSTWDNLNEVRKASLRARELVRQILSFSRQDAQERRPIPLTPLVKEALKLLRASIPSTILIRQNLTAESDIVVADAVQIHQVLMNLGANASYAMRETGGTLEIGLDAIALSSPPERSVNGLNPGNYVRLTVKDTGHGIESAVMDRIFEPFFTTKQVGEGTGLGLSVVHGIIKSHGGEITVTSEVGKGTAFQILLPLVEKTDAAGTTRLALQRGGGERILVVDDEEALARMLRLKLERLGYQVSILTDSAEAAAIFESDPGQFDMVIADQTMPRLTGLQLARQIHTLRQDIPVILYTGYSPLTTPDALREAGVSHCLSKPVDFLQLSNAMRAALTGIPPVV